MKKRFAMLVPLMIGTVVFCGCVSNIGGSVKATAELPKDVNIVPPTPDVPKEFAAFSGPTGKWAGAFYGARTGTWMGDTILVLERITPPTATVIYSYKPSPEGVRYGAPPAWISRITAEFTKEGMKITFPSGSTATYTNNRDGTLGYIFRTTSGSEVRGTLRPLT